MKISTLIILMVVCISRMGLSQNEKSAGNGAILLKNLPQAEQGYKNLNLSFCSEGVYHFVIDESTGIPEGYLVVINDPETGREIFLTHAGPYYFMVNRPGDKNLRIVLRKNVELPRVTQSLLII